MRGAVAGGAVGRSGFREQPEVALPGPLEPQRRIPSPLGTDGGGGPESARNTRQRETEDSGKEPPREQADNGEEHPQGQKRPGQGDSDGVVFVMLAAESDLEGRPPSKPGPGPSRVPQRRQQGPIRRAPAPDASLAGKPGIPSQPDLPTDPIGRQHGRGRMRRRPGRGGRHWLDHAGRIRRDRLGHGGVVAGQFHLSIDEAGAVPANGGNAARFVDREPASRRSSDATSRRVSGWGGTRPGLLFQWIPASFPESPSGPVFDSSDPMKRFLRAILPLVILGGCGYWAWWFIVNRPKTPMVEAPPAVMRVEGTRLRAESHAVRVRSQGTVQPRTRSTLLPEVAAKVIEVSPSFRPGGFFAEGEVLLKLDPVDYETALVVAKAALAQAEVVLAEESAKAAQARENWRALGKSGEPGALALRLPQVAKAQADVAAATAQIAQAERNLERTVIRAPYDGQVLEQLVDVGQYVTEGTALGRIFAVDYVEIRLPLPEREMRFLALPERFRDGDVLADPPVVRLHSVVEGRPALWTGSLVRVESAIDEATRQITAVAQVDDPYARNEGGRPPLKIGQFLEAEIEGQVLENIFRIPRRAVRAGNEILLITPENRLRRLTVEPLLGDGEQIVIAASAPSSPKEGDVLCLTPIPFAAEGASVLPLIDGHLESPGRPPSGKPGGTADASGDEGKSSS